MPTTYTITGKLTQADGSAVANATIKVFNKKLRSEVFLKQAVTSANGSYQVSFDEDAKLDVMIRAIQATKETASAGPFFDISQKKTIDLVIGNKPLVGPRRRNQLSGKANEKLEGIKLSSLTDDELNLLSGKTRIPKAKLSVLSNAESLSDKYGISKDFLYALINSGLKPDLVSLARQPDKILSKAIKKAVDLNEIPDDESDDASITNNISKLRTAAVKESLKTNTDTTSMYSMLKITTLNDVQKEKFLTTLYKNSNDYSKTFDELKSNVIFPAGVLSKVKDIFEIGSLTGDHSSIVSVINKTPPLSKFSVFTKDNWKKFITDNKTSFPQDTPGKDATEKLDNYAQKLVNKFEKEFTGQKVQNKIRAVTKDEDLKKFFDNSPDFNIGNTQINSYLKKNKVKLQSKVTDIDKVSKELKSWQRLFRIIREDDKYESMNILKTAGFDSAKKIIESHTNKGFVKKYGTKLGGDDKAETIYKKAKKIVMATNAVFGFMGGALKNNTASLPKNSGKTKEDDDLVIPDLETLFGSQSYCKCEHCHSALSPAAYMVDMIQFLDKDPDEEGNKGANILFKRRPDLERIKLSCQNTNTMLPYIDLVIEVLENAVSTKKDFSYQTTGTTEQLQAMPENINQEAYDKLKTAVYPFNLPFNLSNTEGDIYMQHLGFSRHELMRIIQYKGIIDPSDAAIAMAHLGLTLNERKIITGEKVIGTVTHDVNNFWGEDGNSDWIKKVSKVETFLEKTGLNFDELLKLLQVKYINPNSKLIVKFPTGQNACDISKAELIYSDNKPLERNLFERIHRFLRLQKKLNWDILDLDKAIKATGAIEINDIFLIQLSNIKLLKEKLKINLTELLSWWAPINTDVDINDEDSRSFYQQLFRNTAVSNPLEEVFKLKVDKSALADEKQNISDYTSAIAAALNLSLNDLDLFLTYLGIKADKLTFVNLCKLYRYASASRAFDLGAGEFTILCSIIPYSPFNQSSIKDAINFYESVKKIKNSGFTPAQLNYLFWHKFDSSDSIAPSDNDIGNLFETLQTGLLKIKSENTFVSDPTGEIVRTKLAMILDSETFQKIVDIINEKSLLPNTDKEAVIKKLLFLTFADAKTKLLTIDTSTPEDKRIQNRYADLLTPLLDYIRKQQSIEFVSQTFADKLNIDKDTSALLLIDLAKSTADPTKSAMSVFLSDKLINYKFSDYEKIITDLSPHYNTYLLLQKAAIIISGFGFNNEEVRWIYKNGSMPTVGWLDLNKLPVNTPADVTGKFESWEMMYEFSIINDMYRSDDVMLINLLDKALPATANITDIITQLSNLTAWNNDDLNFLTGKFEITAASALQNGQAFYKFYEIAKLTEKAGVSAKELWTWADEVISPKIASSIKNAAKAMYSKEAWLKVAPPLRDRLRTKQRDSLAGYLIAYEKDAGKLKFKSESDLLDHYLIDVEMEPSMLTSRIKQACSSIQMFIQRSSMGLEEKYSLDDDQEEQWEVMKNYRVWEANRKVFLWPENWLEPELRTTKTEIFEELQSELMQNEINDENVERAVMRYLEKVDIISHLLVAATYHQKDDEEEINILHVFGRTSSEPYEYYYRTYDYDIQYWSPWEKMDLDIDTPCLTPVLANNKLFLFWPVFIEKSMSNSDFIDNFFKDTVLYEAFKKNKTLMQNVLDNRDDQFVYYEIKIAFSEYKYDKWSSKKVSDDIITTDNTVTAVQFFTNHSIFRKGNFLFIPEINGDVIKMRCIQRTENDSVKLKIVDNYIPKEVVDAWYQLKEKMPFDIPIPVNLTPYVFIEDYYVKYEDERDEINFDDYYEIGYFSYYINDRKINAETEFRFSSLSLQLPLDTKTKYNLIYEKGKDEENSFDFQTPGAHIPDIHFLDDTPGTYSIPFTSQYGKFNPYDNFFFMNGSRRYFVKYSEDKKTYQFCNFYSPYVHFLLSKINQENELSAGLKLSIQKTEKADFEDKFDPVKSVVVSPYPKRNFEFNPGEAYSVYNWEFFFHIPLLIATQLSQNQKFEEATKWFHYIFDPTKRNVEDNQDFWRLKPFNELEDSENDSIYELMYALSSDGDESKEVQSQMDAWIENPFDPHAVATLRINAYMKSTVMKYLDNLIAWGDDLFRRDTIESINEASQLYIMALKILGDRPEEIPVKDTEDKSYKDFSEAGLDEFSNALITEIETYINRSSSKKSRKTSKKGRKRQAPPQIYRYIYFCIPNNEKLITYWDKVEDRLFKIRNSMNIEGVKRSLALFEPPIDPAMLIKARAMGIDLGSILSDLFSPLPNYRFRFFVQKAIQYSSEVQSLGGALLSALEKKDAEQLSLLRSSQELNLLKATKDLKKLQLNEAEEAYEASVKSKELAEIRYNYYKDIEKISAKETLSFELTDAAMVYQTLGQGLDTLASVMHLIPDNTATVPPSTTFGGSNMGNALNAYANYYRMYGSIFSHMSNRTSILAGYDRRSDDWKLQEDLAEKEMEQIDKQIEAAKIRVSIAEKDLKNTELQIDQSKEAYEFMTNKYTNKELYEWMSSQLSRLYFQSYQLAYDCAKRAQKSFQYELGTEDQGFIEYGYWDSLKKGLLAGEKLLYDLKRMEMSYYEQNKRQFEITKNISLSNLDPVSLLRLKENGECFIELPEILFDLDYPGHYMRRIKSVSLTIPCITGPYTNLNCTLTLLENQYRKDPLGAYNESPVGADTRFVYNQAAIQSIATSTGQRDSGVFQLNFEDERYLPFEGAGAASRWRIQLPTKFKSFDYKTISDVIMHLSYTSKEGGETLRSTVDTGIENEINKIVLGSGNTAFNRTFSMKQEFSTEWYKFLNPPSTQTGQSTDIDLGVSKYPILFQGYKIQIKKLEMYLILKDTKKSSPITFRITTPGTKIISPDTILNKDPNLNNQLKVLVISLSKNPDTPLSENPGIWKIFLPEPTAANNLIIDKDGHKRLNADQVHDLILITHYSVS